MENVNYELLILVAVVCICIGTVYGRFTNTLAWHKEINAIKWKAIPKNMTEAISTEKLSGIQGTPVYIVTLEALAEIFNTSKSQDDSDFSTSHHDTLPIPYRQEDQQ